MITVNKNPDRPSARYLIDGVDRTNQLFQIDPTRRIARGFVLDAAGKVLLLRMGCFYPMTFTRNYKTLEIISKTTGLPLDPESIKDTLQ